MATAPIGMFDGEIIQTTTKVCNNTGKVATLRIGRPGYATTPVCELKPGETMEVTFTLLPVTKPDFAALSSAAPYKRGGGH